MSRTRADYIRDQHKIMQQWVDMELDALSDDELLQSVVPGRNHGVWILGHLIASDDTLAMYLGKGDPLFPDRQAFGQSTELLPIEACPPPSVLREEWRAVCKRNNEMLVMLSDDELDDPHSMIEGDPQDDFFKTKERVMIYWTLHQLHHAGQLAMLLSKFGKRTV